MRSDTPWGLEGRHGTVADAAFLANCFWAFRPQVQIVTFDGGRERAIVAGLGCCRMWKPGTLVVEFFAKSSGPDTWPRSVIAYSNYPSEHTKTAARDILKRLFTWADRFTITDHEGALLYEWPERKDA